MGGVLDRDPVLLAGALRGMALVRAREEVQVIDAKEMQTGCTLHDILPCHLLRYFHAAGCFFGLMRRRLGIRAMPQQARILDLFCGNGYGSSILADSFLQWDVLGVDRNAEALAIAGQYYSGPNCSFLQATWPGDAKKVFDEGPFDAIACIESLEHVEDEGLFLGGLTGLLKSGGLLYLSVPNAAALDVKDFPYHFRHYASGELDYQLKSAGFRRMAWMGQIGQFTCPVEGNEHLVHHFLVLAESI